jgi:hypothetical protein
VHIPKKTFHLLHYLGFIEFNYTCQNQLKNQRLSLIRFDGPPNGSPAIHRAQFTAGTIHRRHNSPRTIPRWHNSSSAQFIAAQFITAQFIAAQFIAAQFTAAQFTA